MVTLLVPLIILALFFGLAFLLVEKWETLQFQILSRLFLIILLISTIFYIVRFWVIVGIDCAPECVGVDLATRDLRGLNLVGANFVDANLSRTNFQDTVLIGANFIAANLTGANLQGVDLTNAKLMGANLDSANLSGAILTGADLSGADLVGADLTGMDLTETIIRGAHFSGAELEGADFAGTTLNSVGMSRARLNGANMQGVDLRGADMSGADLSGVQLTGSNLNGVQLNLAILIGAELRNADLTGATLIGATLTSADLSESRMVGTHLSGANLKGANLNDTNLMDAQVRATDLDDEKDIQIDPVLAELNELQLAPIKVDASFDGVDSNPKTEWPDTEIAEQQKNVIPDLDEDDLENAINVGLLYSLSGPMSISEVAVRDGTLLAIEEINDKGGILGHKLYPIIEDGSSEPKFFQEKATKLLERDQVSVIFGCWTSDSRKSILPALEEFDGLLFYPLQYEGFERSKNVFYFGADPAQQIIPAIDYLLAQGHEKFILLGGESIFARTVNLIVQARLNHEADASVMGEIYTPLGEDDFSTVISQLRSNPPDTILNTMYGTSNIAFFRQLQEAGFTPLDISVMTIGAAEEEIRQIGAEYMAEHLIISDYYQTLSTKENLAFVIAYKNAYGPERVTSAPIEAAYTAVYVWKALVEQAQSFATDDIRKAAATGQIQYISPAGLVQFDDDTQQIYKFPRIGQIRDDGLIEEVKNWPEALKPDPFLTQYEWATNLEEVLGNLEN